MDKRKMVVDKAIVRLARQNTVRNVIPPTSLARLCGRDTDMSESEALGLLQEECQDPTGLLVQERGPLGGIRLRSFTEV